MKRLKLMPTVTGMLLMLFSGLSFAKPLTISFATEATYPPFEYIDATGQIKGFDIDIAKAVCRAINATCTFSNQPFASLIPSLKIGKYDALISGLGITKIRQTQVNFSEPYYTPTSVFVAPVSAKLQLSKAAMQGKTVGMQGGTTLINYMTKTYGSAVSSKTYPSQQDAFLDLQSGRVDAVFGDTPLMLEWVKKHGKGQYAVVGKPISDPTIFGAGFGIAVRKGNDSLLQQINAGLAAIKKNGSYEKIYDNYFPRGQATP